MELTVVVALIAVISAIIAPVITAAIQQRGAYKLKSAELFFLAKSTAFQSFLTVGMTYPLSSPTEQEFVSLQKTSAAALLYASSETQEKISVYGTLLVRRSHSDVTDMEVSVAETDAILAMQSELNKYKK